MEPNLKHFRRNRNLSYYMNNIALLTEPTSTPCDSLNEVPLVVLVTSTSSRFEHRDAIRATWAEHYPTYFLLGSSAQSENVANIDLEAKQYNDLIVYDFQDHYQNLTLKTALMLRWTKSRCPSVGFLLKTDDDILINPWIMSNVLKDNINSDLIGFEHYNVLLYRSEYYKWYLPRWLFKEDIVPQYLIGAAYFIRGKYVKKILDAAATVPLINIEDIYFTYLVARSKLGLKLTHDPRLRPYWNFFFWPCVYWPYAISHDLSPQDAARLWSSLVDIAKNYNNNLEVCSFYSKFSRLTDIFSI